MWINFSELLTVHTYALLHWASCMFEGKVSYVLDFDVDINIGWLFH